MTGEEFYQSQFETMSDALAGAGPSWVHDLRMRGLEAFGDVGFPGLRNEEWRFTRVKPIRDLRFEMKLAYKPNGFSEGDITRHTFDDRGCHRITLIDGNLAPELSRIGTLPAGTRVVSLKTAIAETPELIEPHLGRLSSVEAGPFVALNTAFLNDGVFVHVPKGMAIEEPIHIVHACATLETVSHGRVLLVAESGAEATVIESFIGEGTYLNNTVTEIACEANASVRHVKLQRQSTDSFHVSRQDTHLARDCRFSTENIALGGGLVRNDIASLLDGEGIDCRVDGLYLGRGRQHVDNHTHIRHAKPNCFSFELYKGILADKSRGVFNGRIYVDQDAQKTDAKQSNNCILLSDDARINTNPQLEIFADDVKCTHGATVGQLDETAVFYLRSRGINEVDARQILVRAFAGEVIERIAVAPVRERLEFELTRWLAVSLVEGVPS